MVMSTAKRAMLALQQGLRRWEPLIKRATHCTSIKYTVQDTGDFTVTVKWPGGGSYTKLFKREEVFPRITAGVPIYPKKKPCRYADDIIMEVLEERMK